MNFYVVSSAHWDREWYDPFQKYRFRLVRMMDHLLEVLESHPEYACFHLDGQTVVIGDYLAVRPENADRLKALIEAGRIQIGPWYTMPDEWLCSGESLIKNLQTGFSICDQYGVTPPPCGYICDLFGHNSQMPQIFRQFGLRSTAFFRGVEDTRKDLFRWEGADKSEVVCFKLHRDYAYSTFYFVLRKPFEKKEWDEEELCRRFADFLGRERENFATENVLLIDGVDHIDPEEKTPWILEVLRRHFPEHTFVQTGMGEYLRAAETDLDKLEKLSGCLYEAADDGVNQAVLKNCASSLADQKQDNAFCETRLERLLSPLNFLVLNLPKKPREKHFRSAAPYNGFFEEAWKLLLQNHAHDSICGCSVTPTHRDTKNRFKNAREIVEVCSQNLLAELAENADTAGAGQDGTDAFVIYNPSQCEIDGVTAVELDLPVVPESWNYRFFDAEGNRLDYCELEAEDVLVRDTTFSTLIDFIHTRRVKIALPLHIPAGGYQTVYHKILASERDLEKGWEFQHYEHPYRPGGSQRVRGLTFDNGPLEVTVCPNGTLQVRVKETGRTYRDLLTFEDCGDVGDGWNYLPPAFDSRILSSACPADISVEKDTAFVTVLKIVSRMRIPAAAEGGKRTEERKDLFVESRITLKKGDTRIDVETRVDNGCKNHRLRAMFPTNLNCTTFRTAIPFDFYAWPVAKRDNTFTKEYDSGVNPNQGAMALREGKDVFALYDLGQYECAVADDAERTAYLTLFRSFTNEVGSFFHEGLGNQLGPQTFRYAMDFLTGTEDFEILRRAEAFRLGLSALRTGIHGGALPACLQGVRVEGKAVLSFLACRDGVNTLRLFDVSGGERGKVAFFRPVKRAFAADLLGNRLAELRVEDGKICYELSDRQILTIDFEF